MDLLMDAYRNGDYEGALRIIEGAKGKSFEESAYLYFRGAMLHHLGRLPEAQASLRKGIPLEEHRQWKALAQGTPGAVLMDQERYPEAIAVLENSVKAWPDRGSSHRVIAELWLRQNRELGTALDEARHALEIDRAARGLPQQSLDSRVGEDLATLAWAEAASERCRRRRDALRGSAALRAASKSHSGPIPLSCGPRLPIAEFAGEECGAIWVGCGDRSAWAVWTHRLVSGAGPGQLIFRYRLYWFFFLSA